MTITSDNLLLALDGRWHDTKTLIRQKLSLEIFRPHFTPTKSIARARVNEQLRIIAAAGCETVSRRTMAAAAKPARR